MAKKPTVYDSNPYFMAKMQREMSEFKAHYVKVGLIDNPQHKNSSLGIAEIGAIHEYGAPSQKIPERSFIRGWAKQEEDRIPRMIAIMLRKIQEGKLTAQIALKMLGNWARGGVQLYLTTHAFKALSERTIAQRNPPSSRPLIDTGQLRSSIRFAVVNGRYSG